MRVYTFHCYQDTAGEWRWRLKSRNGKIIADSGEGYSSPKNLRRAVTSVLRLMNVPHVEVEWEKQ